MRGLRLYSTSELFVAVATHIMLRLELTLVAGAAPRSFSERLVLSVSSRLWSRGCRPTRHTIRRCSSRNRSRVTRHRAIHCERVTDFSIPLPPKTERCAQVDTLESQCKIAMPLVVQVNMGDQKLRAQSPNLLFPSIRDSWIESQAANTRILVNL